MQCNVDPKNKIVLAKERIGAEILVKERIMPRIVKLIKVEKNAKSVCPSSGCLETWARMTWRTLGPLSGRLASPSYSMA